MNNLKEIEDIFSIFHDGTITDWERIENGLRLTIDCEYLAELIEPERTIFSLELTQIDKLSMDPWMNPIELESRLLTEPEDIFKAELEILSAEVEQDYVRISCNQHDTDFNYCGGTIHLSANAVVVKDEKNRVMTVENLHSICKRYWDKFGAEN